MRIEPAKREDIPRLALIAELSYRSAFAGILEDEILSTRDAAFFAERFETSWERMLVAFSGESPSGFLLMTEGHIDMLFMDPRSSRRGGGALLLREAERLGATSLECFRDNRHARQFYERHGWRVVHEYERDFAGRSRNFVLYKKPFSAVSQSNDTASPDSFIRSKDNP
ncbi:GNAT family N-acetyltransferase [Microvirga rosea]|uniref:GNAT family N-acetyltransferase n=1 Tax=Microvirga rosea TaxID=2715425 RepID=UPI001D0AD65F|nr:GNAT family N-acetyltransferase [Microvirga rosea]MCB8822550.1 GNAT family N-acetyltransferase [Microvirga rosea]